MVDVFLVSSQILGQRKYMNNTIYLVIYYILYIIVYDQSLDGIYLILVLIWPYTIIIIIPSNIGTKLGLDPAAFRLWATFVISGRIAFFPFVQVVDLPLALGGLGYYPDEDAIQEHLLAIGERESEECLTPEELARFLQKYRQVSLGLVFWAVFRCIEIKKGPVDWWWCGSCFLEVLWFTSIEAL